MYQKTKFKRLLGTIVLAWIFEDGTLVLTKHAKCWFTAQGNSNHFNQQNMGAAEDERGHQMQGTK